MATRGPPLESPEGGVTLAASPDALMDPRELVVLRDLAAGVPRHQAIVELGSYRGGSAVAMVEGALGGYGAHVTCIDPWPTPGRHERDREHAARQRGALSAFTETMRLRNWPVTALRARSTDIAPYWLQPVGLLFIDADHSYAQVMADYRAWAPHVVVDGWIALHDYYDDGELTIPGDTARVIDGVITPSRLWTDPQLIEKLWIAKRR